MDAENLKYVVGKAEEGQPRFQRFGFERLGQILNLTHRDCQHAQRTAAHLVVDLPRALGGELTLDL